jgi:putative tryptophan/tyrosine transport system substrate-binding protein
MKRREFITLLSSAAATSGCIFWPLATRAQQPDRVRRICVLMGNAESDVEGESGIAAFRDELRKAGGTEGRKVDVETRWAAMTIARRSLRLRRATVSLPFIGPARSLKLAA